ncbi:MAG: GNAT family N-acetyltransferase [Myxococcota bacterium]
MSAADAAEPKVAYRFRRVGPDDRATLRHLVETYVTPRGNAARYGWLYEQNPQGPTESWIALEPSRGGIVGFTSIFPRSFSVHGRMVQGGVGFDAFVRPDHRRRGLALALHKASLASMRSREVPFHFMCGPPVRANLEALIKAGSQVVTELRYYGLPLRLRGVAELVPKLSVPELPGRALRSAAEHLFWQAFGLSTGRVRARAVDRMDARFDALWDTAKEAFGVIGLRDARYLEWRYLRNPVSPSTLLALEDGNHLLGWAVLEAGERGVLWLDHLWSPAIAERAALLRAVMAHAASMGGPRLIVRLSPEHPLAPLLGRHGFVSGMTRDPFQVLVADDALGSTLTSAPSWHFADGDLNPESAPWSVNTAPAEVWGKSEFIAGPEWVPPA